MEIIVISDNILELNLTKAVKSIKLKIFEELNLVGNCIDLTFSSEQNVVPIRINNANGNIFIEIIEINGKDENFGIFKLKQSETNIEKIDTLDNITKLFGQQEISLTDSTIEDTNKVFDNFGKGLSTLFGTKKLNENVNQIENDFSFNIVKK